MSYTIVEGPGGIVTLATQGPGAGFVVAASQTTNGHVVSGAPAGATVTATPAISGSNAATLPLVISGNDTAGRVTQPASANPVVGNIAQVIFGQAYQNIPIVSLTGATASSALNYYVAAASTNSFIVGVGTVAVASATVLWTYAVIG